MSWITKETLKQWLSLKAQLANVKKAEMSARLDICKAVMGRKKIGTHKKVYDEIEVKASATESLSITREILLAHQETLSDVEKECIVWKPSIDKKKYDQLPKDAPLRHIVSMKVNAPTLEVLNLEL